MGTCSGPEALESHARISLIAVKIAEDIVVGEHNVAEIDAEAILDAALIVLVGLASFHARLDIDGAPHSVLSGRKLGKHSVAGRFNDTAPVATNLGSISS